MKTTIALPILTLALAALGTTLPAQTPAPAPATAPTDKSTEKTDKSAPPKTYDDEESYENAYIDSYKGTGHVNARPISVDAPEIDPLLLEDEILPLDVKVEFTVTDKGTVKKPVIKTDTDFQIAQSVIDAIYNWRFTPALHDGKPVSERLLLTLEFIDDDEIPAPPAATSGKATVAQNKGKKGSKMKLTPVATVASADD